MRPVSRRFAAPLLLLLAVVSACHDGGPLDPGDDPRFSTLRVMTRNLYIGGDIGPVFQADFSNPVAVLQASATVWAQIQGTDFTSRVERLADEIAARHPEVVSLQEAFRFIRLDGSFQPVAVIDYIELLESEPLATAWGDACEAILLWLSGDVERSVELLRRAAEALDAIPIKWEAARVRRQLAGRLADLGRREEALTELREVHEAFGELGAQPELTRCRGMFRELESRPPSRIEAEGTAELTPREVDVAVRIARRCSNKAVARELGISPRTVTTHLSNIYRKLGIGSRGELVDLVREARIPLG